MKDITAEERAALRILIGCGVYAVHNVPASKTAERVKAAMQTLAPHAFGQLIIVPEPEDSP